MFKTAPSGVVLAIAPLQLWICFGFRASDFGFGNAPADAVDRNLRGYDLISLTWKAEAPTSKVVTLTASNTQIDCVNWLQGMG